MTGFRRTEVVLTISLRIVVHRIKHLNRLTADIKLQQNWFIFLPVTPQTPGYR